LCLALLLILRERDATGHDWTWISSLSERRIRYRRPNFFA